jgi:hypothetical protein
MGLDFLHAVFQFPVAAIELTVAIAMAARAYWAKHAAVHPPLDPVVTTLLAVFLAVIGVKQGFWSIWGALQAADLIAVSEQVRTHIWPVINNALITLVGLVLLARLVGVYIGPRAYVGAAMVGGLLLGVGTLVVRQGW